MNKDRYIVEALMRRVESHKAVVGLPIRYIGVSNFLAPTNGKWFECVFIPNNGRDEYWGDGKTYKGMFRLVLHWPMHNQGILDAMDKCKEMADLIPKGSQFTDVGNNVTVTITDHPDYSDILEDENELLVGLTFYYRSFIL